VYGCGWTKGARRGTRKGGQGAGVVPWLPEAALTRLTCVAKGRAPCARQDEAGGREALPAIVTDSHHEGTLNSAV
jgi:hypothetical protein